MGVRPADSPLANARRWRAHNPDAETAKAPKSTGLEGFSFEPVPGTGLEPARPRGH